MAHELITEAIILAAGMSSRMGLPKALLTIDARSLLECLALSFREAGADRIIVVTGCKQAALMPIIKQLGVDYVFNPRYREEMMHSVKCGVVALNPECRAFFVAPVDAPQVSSSTIRSLIQAFRDGQGLIIHPCYARRRGHPPLISADLASELLQWQGESGLKGFLRSKDSLARELQIDDPAVLNDFDCPEDLEGTGIKLE